MKSLFIRKITVLIFFVSLGGCAIGFDHTLFMTKSNIGVDIDTKPPTAEISIARRELVIAPTFAGGQTPPVLASFRTGNRWLFGFDVSSVFSGGDAASTLAQSDKGNVLNSKLCLTELPLGTPHFLGIPLGTYSLPTQGEIRPFVFGTDTTFGLKVAWSGMTAQFPDSLKIGFNRKEFALAPVFMEHNQSDTTCSYSVKMPAFLATIEAAVDGASPESIDSKYRQSFSTGAAANALAGNSDVKKLLLARLDRAYEIGSYNPDKSGGCIDQWLTGDETQKNTRAKVINEWLKKNNHEGLLPLFINDPKYTQERDRFIKENSSSIKCP